MLDPRNDRAAHALLRRVLPALLAAALLADPTAAQGWRGTFAGEGMVLTLEPACGRCSGTLIFDDRFYAVDAEEVDGELRGTFATVAGSYDFRAAFVEGVLVFESNGISYRLRRRADAADAGAAVTAARPGEISAAGPTSEPGDERTPGPAAEATIKDDAGVAAEPGGGEPTPPSPSPTAAAAEPEEAEPDVLERDADLVGTWGRLQIPADADTPHTAATALELAADGSYAFEGGSPAAGRWRTDGRTLYVRTSEPGQWRSFCSYLLVGDSLLCTFGEGSRQLWHRR